jgi:hypothetical protein
MARLALMLACLWATPSLAGTPGNFEGWELEHGVDPPCYSVIDPQSTALNIDSVVLACEEAGDHRILQLQLYLSTEGPLLPRGVPPLRLKNHPRAEISIDGRVFPVGLLFADDHVVLADETEPMFPWLSDRLLDTMEKGRTMVLRFDLVAELAGQPAAFDGGAVIALQVTAGGKAVSAMRRCASPVGMASATHDRP